MSIAHTAQLARLVVLLAANTHGQTLLGEGQRDGVGEAGEGRRESIDGTVVLVGVRRPHMRTNRRTWRMNTVSMSCARRDGREDHDDDSMILCLPYVKVKVK